jgi:hypothetical protein
MEFRAKPYVNFAERDFNRTLPVKKVLEKRFETFQKLYHTTKNTLISCLFTEVRLTVFRDRYPDTLWHDP